MFPLLCCVMAGSRDSEGLVWSQAEGSPRVQWGNRGTVSLGNKDQGQEVFHRFEAEVGAELEGCGGFPAGAPGRNGMGEGRKFFCIPSISPGVQHGAFPFADALPAPQPRVGMAQSKAFHFRMIEGSPSPSNPFPRSMSFCHSSKQFP